MKLRKHQESRRGTAIIEAALVMPFFFLLILGIMEYGRFLMMRNIIDNATREGARYAVVHTYDATASQVTARVNSYLGNQASKLSGLTIQVYLADPATGANLGSWDYAKFGDAIAVRITGNYLPVVRGFLFLPNSIPMTSVCMMRSEAN